MKAERKRTLLYVLGGIFLGFILLTFLVSLFPNSLVDREFSEEIQEHQYPLLDALMKIISWPGYTPESIIIVFLTSGTFMLFKKKRESLFILFTLLSGVISHSLKIIIDRPRPTVNFVRIIEIAKYQSFPSGHVLFYVIFFGFIIVLMNHLKAIQRRLRMTVISICIFLIFTIPFSRIYLGAHWFTDVLGGFMLGMLGLFILSYYYFKKKPAH
ncbi:MAG: phosphatase PAP2 family protein [Daejeonella sp.]